MAPKTQLDDEIQREALRRLFYDDNLRFGRDRLYHYIIRQFDMCALMNFVVDLPQFVENVRKPCLCVVKREEGARSAY